MESELWKQVYQMVVRTGKGKTLKRAKFTDADIVITYLWSVLHDRPVSWACNRSNWPIYYRRRVLPTPSTMTRRLHKGGVLSLLHKLEYTLVNMFPRSTCRWIDGKPLPVGGASKDKESAFGYGASCIAKGYKLYAVADNNQGFVSWTVRSMNQSEHKVAAELIEELEHEGYLVGDGAYDKNQLYAMAARKSIQLVTPQRIKKAKGLGHRRNHPYRIRAMSMNKRPFGQGLIESRKRYRTNVWQPDNIHRLRLGSTAILGKNPISCTSLGAWKNDSLSRLEKPKTCTKNRLDAKS